VENDGDGAWFFYTRVVSLSDNFLVSFNMI
jgi:hypothetical protein